MSEEGLKLHLGCGTVLLPGYVNIDGYRTEHRGWTEVQPDRILRVEELDYPAGSVEEIYTAHTLEHLGATELKRALLCWHRVLRPRGRLIIEVPDAEAIMRRLLRQKSEEAKDLYYYLLHGTQEFEGEFHKGSFTYNRLVRLLSATGFEEFENAKRKRKAFAGTPYYKAFRGRAWRCVLLSCRKPLQADPPDEKRLDSILLFKYENQDLFWYRWRLRLSRLRNRLRG